MGRSVGLRELAAISPLTCADFPKSMGSNLRETPLQVETQVEFESDFTVGSKVSEASSDITGMASFARRDAPAISDSLQLSAHPRRAHRRHGRKSSQRTRAFLQDIQATPTLFPAATRLAVLMAFTKDFLSFSACIGAIWDPFIVLAL